MMRLAGQVLDWARHPARCLAVSAVGEVGEVGRFSRVAVSLLGEVLELHQHADMAVLQLRDVAEPWHGCDDTARVLARGAVTPRALRRALDRLGYG